MGRTIYTAFCVLASVINGFFSGFILKRMALDKEQGFLVMAFKNNHFKEINKK